MGKSNSVSAELGRKINNKTAHIAVLGLGYVGLPLALAYAKRGFRVTGIDTDAARVKKLERGQSYVDDVSARELVSVRKKHHFQVTSNFDILAGSDVIMICVPTPLNKSRDPDLSYILGSVKSVIRHLQRGQLIILESTTYPGTTEEVVAPMLQEKGMVVGKDIFVCFSPERVDPGNSQYSTVSIPKVIGGMTAECAKLARDLYSTIVKQIHLVSSPKAAEMTKLLENTFRIVNIGLINEIARVAGQLGVNIWEVIDAAKTKPFGFMPFYPGPGIGGHCIGVDPLYLSWKARMQGADLHFIELARSVNAEMPAYVVSQALVALNQRFGKAVKNAKILILGLTYKKDIADIRESPAIEILHRFSELGARVQYSDPWVPHWRGESMELSSAALTVSFLKSQDLIMVATDHSNFPYARIAQHGRLIYDARNALKKYQGKNIVRL